MRKMCTKWYSFAPGSRLFNKIFTQKQNRCEISNAHCVPYPMGNVNANGNLFIYFYSPQFSSCSLAVCPAVLFLQLANENSSHPPTRHVPPQTTMACQSHFVFNLRQKVCHGLLQAELRLSDSRLCVCVLCAWHVCAYQLISICKWNLPLEHSCGVLPLVFCFISISTLLEINVLLGVVRASL